ncbi:GDP-mannose transporter into the lumen of the Golgi [Podila humilis]|nr:GDP-mannose transporter into the lumen of the Golgi [Podila humilis]
MTARPPASTSIANSAAVSILAYCSSSIVMTVSNKMILSRFDFNMNFLLLSIQASESHSLYSSAVSIILLTLFKRLGLISYRRVTKDEAKKCFPTTVALILMIYTGIKSLQFLSIPIYTIFKNLTIILIAYGEVLWFGSKVTPIMLLSFVIMVLSSVIAGWSDISSFVPKDPTDLIQFNEGYLWMGLNCFSSAGYVLYLRKRIKHFNFKDFDTVYYNNITSFPILIFLSFTMEGWTSGQVSRTFSPDVRTALAVAMVISGVSSFLISYGSAWCVRCTTSTTYSMVGALNKLPVAASGILFLGDPATTGNVLGISFGFIAGLLFSYSKTDQAQQKFTAQTSSSSSSDMKLSAINNTNIIKLDTSASQVPLLSPVIELAAPLTHLPSKSTALPLYKPNPDGKSAD